MRRILFGGIALLGAAAFLLFTLGSSNGPTGRVYHIELDNAYDLVNGGVFKVAGVNAGTISAITLDPKTLHAVVTVTITQNGFGQFHRDAFCQSRPQSLIGEYFVDCQPGSAGPVLRSGSTIPASQTQSTIPADLVQNIMRLPYRERFSLIINELGAAVAARSEDLQTALRRADPALAETDNLLALLANDAQTIKQLNVNANTVITALAKNNVQVQRFIVDANRAAGASATQASNITATWNKLPGFLEQLRPAMAKLGAAADAQDPVLVNLNAAASNLTRFFHDLVPFSHESVPSLRSLGKASVTGRSAVTVATPTITDLNRFAAHTPELAQNLAIVLHALDDRGRAVEPDLRSPDGGKGYTGLEGLLQYVFNITLAINYFSPYGHMLGVDAFANSVCSPYATPQTIANNIKSDGRQAVRSCYAFMGPNQPGVNEPDPTFNAAVAKSLPGHPNGTNGCVPDPGGYPVEPSQYHIHYHGPNASACKLGASGPASDISGAASGQSPGTGLSTSTAAASSSSSGSPTLQGLINNLFAGVKHAAAASTSTGSGNGVSASQARQLLNYLLAP
jgi:ABC-type transporter Mla subunit MlaD